VGGELCVGVHNHGDDEDGVKKDWERGWNGVKIEGDHVG
jgi:hypothetical protein